MYVRNRDHHPIIELEYLGLKREAKFWFPHVCKYFAWFIVVASIIVSSIILIYYGMSFGMIKTYLWLTGIISSFLISMLIFAPVRIIILALVDSLFFKFKPTVDKRKIYTLFLHNPDDADKHKEIENLRRYNENLYKPIKLYKLKNRLEDVKYNIELRNLTIDVISYVIFMVTVFYVVLFNKTELTYYSSEVIKNLVVRASYTNSLPFTEVVTYETFLEYLNHTLLPALMLNHEDYSGKLELEKSYRSKPKRKHKHIKVVESSTGLGADSMKSLRKRQIFQDFNDLQNNATYSDIFHRGWTMDPAIKLIGIPRMRQIRVSLGSCNQLLLLQGRNPACASELTLFNEETRDFSLEWSLPPVAKGLTSMQETPWIHKSGWKTSTLPIFAKFSFYNSGGYILNFARNINDSRIVLNFMDAFQWVDVQTRVVYIEFTTYCINTNAFNVVTLIAERSATGYFIPSYQIETCKFLFLMKEVEIIYVVMTILFAMLLFCFLFREGLRIHRTSIFLYLKRAFAVLNLTIIICGVVSVLFIILRSHYVSHLLKELEVSSNNIFVGFAYAAFWYTCSTYLGALLVCLASFKLFHLLTYRVVFYRLHTTISHCYKHFIDLIAQFYVLILAFSMFFYLTLFLYDYEFSSFSLAFSTTTGRSVALDDTFDFDIFFNCPAFVTLLYFLGFVIIITMVMINLFIAVICFFFGEVGKEFIINKYSIKKYIKYILTRDKKSDLLHLKSKKWNETEKSRDASSIESISQKLSLDVERPSVSERKIIRTKEFVRKRPIDITRYKGLSLTQEIAMKALTVAALNSDEAERCVKRQTALKAFFLYLLTNRNVLERSKVSGRYFVVVKDSLEKVMNESRLKEMKNLIEDFGRLKKWTTKEIDYELNISNIMNKITELNKKLTLIIQLHKKI